MHQLKSEPLCTRPTSCYNCSMAKQALRVLAVMVMVLGLFVRDAAPAFAQDISRGEQDERLIDQYKEATANCEDPSLECLIYYTLQYTTIHMTNQIVPIGGDDSSGDTNDSGDANQLNQRKGVVPALAHLIGQMYASPPANTHAYVADVLNSAGVNIAQPAYAQGLGFVALNPILQLWKTFRNIAYMFFVLIFIVIGFLIMFRKKVNQQAITAQQAIPSIIVSLLFVTFSYAIAGFLIDLMYLSMYLIIGVFSSVFDSNPDIINYDIIDLSWTFMKTGAVEGFNTGSNLVEKLITEITGRGEGVFINAFEWIGGITVGLVIAIAVLIGAFKLFFELLKSYATIVLLVVTAPIQLMMGAIPGRNAFTPWLMNLIANLSPFPTVLMVAVMFYLFTQEVSTSQGGFMPPFLVGRGMQDAIASLMGLAILLAMPEVVKEVKKKLGATEGGFGQLVASAGWDRAKAGWSGQGMPFGIGARAITRTGGGLMLGTGGAVIGSGINAAASGIRAYRRGDRGEDLIEAIRKGAKTGAIYGGIAGGTIGTGGQLVTTPIRLVNRIVQPLKNINEGYDAVQDYRESRSLREVFERWRVRESGVRTSTSGTTASGSPEADVKETPSVPTTISGRRK